MTDECVPSHPRRDLPPPGSPTTPTTWPRPVPARSRADLLHLGTAADKAREPAPRCGVKSGAGSAGPHKLEHLDRLGEALDRHRAEWVNLSKALGQAQRLGGKPNTAGCRELLHARRQVCGPTYCRVVHPQIAAKRAYYDLAGADPDPHLQGWPVVPPHFVRVPFHHRLHAERRVTCPRRMILVGNGGTE